MEEKLVEFANLLRQNGLRVSVAEVLDAFAASDLAGLGERDIFRSALRATMVKRASEVPIFDELFDLYFSGLGEIIKQAGQGVQDALSMSDEEFQQFLEQMEEMLKQQGKELSELAKALLSNNNGQLEKMLREAARNARLGNIERTIEESYFARALARELGLDRLERELEEFRSSSTIPNRERARGWRNTCSAGCRLCRTSSGATCGWSGKNATSRRAKAIACSSSAKRVSCI